MLIAQITDIHLGFDPVDPDELAAAVGRALAEAGPIPSPGGSWTAR